MTALINCILPQSWAQQIHAFLEKRAALKALRTQNKRIREAKEIVAYSEQQVPRWKLFLEFRVFRGVQGDRVTPDVIHGQSLEFHVCKRLLVIDEDDSSYYRDIVVCSDDQGRWFELTGRLDQFCGIVRINAQEGADRLSEFNALQQLAATPLAGAKT